MTETGDWVRVTSRSRCTICGGDSWCVIAPSGWRYCMRDEHGKRAPNGSGTLHPPEGGAAGGTPPPLPPRREKPSLVDWRAAHEECKAAIGDEQVLQLAASLGVDAIALRELGVGWREREGMFSFPMFDGTGAIVGLKLRSTDGRKLAVSGGHLGVMRRLEPDDGLLLVAEGESDAASGLSFGFDSIATPGAGQCAETVAAYARDRDCVIVADNDEPGQRGAATIATAIRSVAKSVRIVTPPTKDLRQWLNDGASREDVEALIEQSKPLAEKPRGQAPRDVLQRWRSEGRLIHQATGIASLDQATRGGPIFGQLWGITGPPDGAKTGIMVEIADYMASRGVLVGFLAIDEDDDGLLTRFAQRAGVDRFDCEQREPETLRAIEDAVGKLPVRFFGDAFTIDAAAEQLAAEAARLGMRAALFVDSLQTARCAAESAEGSRYDQVSARVAALRTAARRHRLVVIFTSEQNRAAYKTAERDKSLSEMSAGKASGDIEYAAKVLLSLRATDEPDGFELRIVKNKHGRSHGAREPGIGLRLDRNAQRLTEAALPATQPVEAPDGTDLTARIARIEGAMRVLPNMTAPSKAAIYAAAKIKPALGLPAVDYMVAVGAIKPGGTSRERTFRLVEGVCVQPPHTPLGNGNAFPAGGNARNGNGNGNDERRDLQ